ncbi:Coagulation factor V light chain like [Actinidia chinensis var. chinensis]|uniref:Coagulation factor V light chain like n=1 Tax=Actinidia chinensis var. chinensis TaxID=1590841 RepID=A0A2R6R1W2_ACTCC|nr:Coagulation factor V light chain like [Actinidia chinensis var. chinensis]
MTLPVRVATAMQESLGVVSALAKVYKSTHFNRDTNEWITPESEVIHDKIEQIEVEQNLQNGAIPITQEELSIKVFGRRSGYVTGLGLRSSSSSRSIVGHVNNIKYVTQLEQKVQEQADQIQEQADQIQEQAKGIEAANNKIHELVEAKEEQGRTLASVMEYLKHQGYTG